MIVQLQREVLLVIKQLLQGDTFDIQHLELLEYYLIKPHASPLRKPH